MKRINLPLRPAILVFALWAWANHPATAEIVQYDLTIDYQTVNFTGNDVQAMTINGAIPGPTLKLIEGDDVVIRVHNRMDVSTSIHWHGLLLPNKEDGVPYLTTPPIKPGTTHTFSFPIIQSGTYWYHAHTGLQEQRGVFGSIVINPKVKQHQVERDYVVVLSDWTDENPNEVLRTLKRGSEYYSLKKGSAQSLVGALQAGALKQTIDRSLMRMPPMDLSDVAYDQFLINGKTQTTLEAVPGETVRLRIINAAASTYFYVQFAGGPLKVVSADGLDIKPVKLDRVLIAIAETYDVIVQMPDDGGAIEFRATAQDGSGHTSVFIGDGLRMAAPDVPKPNLYKMGGGMGMKHGGSGGMKMKAKKEKHKQQEPSGSHASMPSMTMTNTQPERPLPPYAQLRALEPTVLNQNLPWQTVELTLTGDMERYIWSFNGKTLTEADQIVIRRGQNVRMIFKNKTMMHHPIHLHGHFFRVLNGQGDHAPLKHTVDIAPLGRQVIEFHGSEDKDWFMHCHILYHMMSGMARVVHYEGSTPSPELAAAREEPGNELKHDPWFFWGEVSFLSKMTDGSMTLSNTRNIFSIVWKSAWEDQGDDDQYEIDFTYNYYFDRFLTVFAGANVAEEETRGVFGLRTLIPLNIDTSIWVDTDGAFRLSMGKELQVTDRLAVFADAEYDTDSQWEWVAGVNWTLSKEWSIVAQYHSEFGGGAGVTLRF